MRRVSARAGMTTEHVVTVTGLLSGTQYYYSVGEIGTPLAGDDADHHFRTAPVPGTAVPMRLWSIGDAGFVGANLDSVRDAYGVFNGTTAADLFLLLGDNVYGSERPQDFAKKFEKRVNEYEKRWEQELGEYLGEVPHFAEVERKVRRALRGAALL